MKLYHFTSKEHLAEILKDGFIKLSPSNLEEPQNLHIDENTLTAVADNDDVRPVVWLTSTVKVSMSELGGNSYTKDDLSNIHDENTKKRLLDSKDSVRITVEKTADMYRWTRWAQGNGIDPKWFKALKQAASDNANWFIVERTIPVKDFISVEVNGKEIEDLDQWLVEYEKDH